MITIKNWRGEEVKKVLAATIDKKLEVAAILVKNHAQVLVSQPSPPASLPGEPPHKDTGRLRASITYKVDKGQGVARVGSNLAYAKILELGSSRRTKKGTIVILAARPWLRRAFIESYATIRKIFGG